MQSKLQLNKEMRNGTAVAVSARRLCALQTMEEMVWMSATEQGSPRGEPHWPCCSKAGESTQKDQHPQPCCLFSASMMASGSAAATSPNSFTSSVAAARRCFWNSSHVIL